MKWILKTLLLLPLTSVFAQWQQTNGPGGGPVWAIYSNASVMIAGSEGGSILRSVNNGAAWQNYGLLGQNLPIADFCEKGTDLFAANAEDGVFRSPDNGVTWTNIGLPKKGIRTLAANSTAIFAGSDSAGVFISTNNGVSWQAVNNGLTDLFIHSLVCSGSDIFVGTQTGIFRSSNNGQSWATINTGLSGQSFDALAVFGTDMFAGSANGGGISHSTNNGISWAPVNTGLSNGFGSNKLAARAFAKIGNIIFMVCAGGVFSTSDNGSNWTAVNNGLNFGSSSKQVYDLTVNGTDLFVTTQRGISMSSNSGSSWVEMNTGLSTQNVKSFAVHNNMLFAGTHLPNVFATSDQGLNWTGYSPTFNSLQTYLSTNVINALLTKGNLLFAGIGNTGIYKSTDQGMTWSTANNGLNFHDVRSLGLKDSILFAGTCNGGVFRSLDNGNSWTAVNNGLPANLLCVYAFATDGNYLYIGVGKSNMNARVYRTSNNGGSWVSVSNGLDPQFDFKTLAVLGNTLFAGSHAGVFSSVNSGNSWTQMNSGIHVNHLTVYDTSIYAATQLGGVFTSHDAGLNWQAINNGLKHMTVNTLITAKNKLYAGTNGGSVYSWDLNPLSAGIHQQAHHSSFISLYPNPANNKVSIQGIKESCLLKLYNNMGQLMIETRIENDSTLSLEELNPGCYTLMIEKSNQLISYQRLMIHR